MPAADDIVPVADIHWFEAAAHPLDEMEDLIRRTFALERP